MFERFSSRPSFLRLTVTRTVHTHVNGKDAFLRKFSVSFNFYNGHPDKTSSISICVPLC